MAGRATLDRVSSRCGFLAVAAALMLACATVPPVADLPSCTRYALRRGAGGLVLVERSPLGLETALPAHWVDSAGDHFAVWDNGSAREVWIPADRGQSAYLFVYRADLYQLRDTSGVKHPVPLIPVEARAKLGPLQVTPP